jgi:hypothetical protein
MLMTLLELLIRFGMQRSSLPRQQTLENERERERAEQLTAKACQLKSKKHFKVLDLKSVIQHKYATTVGVSEISE